MMSSCFHHFNESISGRILCVGRTVAIAAALTQAFPQLASAQITPDGSLDTNPSVVLPESAIRTRIDGGVQQNTALFHSFQDFNIETNNSVYFANPADIEAIFTRVTGTNLSQLDGTLGVLGSADLFLLNPNGIVFGPDAQLDISGSFTASTAESFEWSDGSSFSAVNPAIPPTLTVSLTPGIQQGLSADIVQAGQLTVGQDLNLSAGNLDLQGQLEAGQDLMLTATDTVRLRDSAGEPFGAIAGRTLTIAGDQIDIFTLNHPDSGLISGADLVLRSPNPVIGDARYWSGSNFKVETNNGQLSSLVSPADPVIRTLGDVSFDTYTGSSLHILAGGQVNINAITIDSPEVGITNGDFLQEVVQLSNGSTIRIDGSLQPTLDIRAGIDPAEIGTPSILGVTPPDSFTPAIPSLGSTLPTQASISVGDITIIPPNGLVFLTTNYAPNPSLTGDRIILTGTLNTRGSGGDGGDIVIDSRDTILLSTRIDTSPAGFFSGDAGDVTLLAQGDIDMPVTGKINAIGLQGGAITFNSQEDITFTGGVGTNGNILTLSTTDAPGTRGGDIEISGRSISMLEGAQITSRTFDTARSGDVILRATDQIILEGTDSTGFPVLLGSFVLDGASGDAGNVLIESPNLRVLNGAQVSAFTRGSGNAGDLTVIAQSVEVSGQSSILIPTARGALNSTLEAGADPGSTGRGGTLQIQANDLLVSDQADIASNTEGSGDAKELRLDVDRIRIEGGGQISTSTSSTGNAGNLIVNSQLIEIIGTAEDVSTNSSEPSGIFAATVSEDLGAGLGGFVLINTEHLVLQNGGQIGVQSSSSGDAGNLTVRAQSISLTDSNSDARRSGIIAGTSAVATGNGGRLVIEATDISLTNSFFAVENQGSGRGGELEIIADSLFLRDEAEITAETANNQGGNITLLIDDVILLRNGSNISATAGTTGTEGDGGNVTIDTNFLVSPLDENNNITANADLGRGGRIQITALGVYGIENQANEIPVRNDITASSNANLDGEVNVNTLDLDPTRDTTRLPSDTGTPTISQRCNPGQGVSSFVATGRGGVPLGPEDAIAPHALWEELYTPNDQNIASEERPVFTMPTAAESFTEAQGWEVNTEGNIVFVTDQVSLHRTAIAHTCSLEG